MIPRYSREAPDSFVGLKSFIHIVVVAVTTLPLKASKMVYGVVSPVVTVISAAVGLVIILTAFRLYRYRCP